MTHDDLQRSLVEHFRTTGRANIWAWSEIGLSGSWGSGGRLDVVTLTWLPNHRGCFLHGYEVKANRRDFTNDIQNGKYAQYFDAVDSLSFAVPAGLVKGDEVPPECGIITLGKNGWRNVRKAPVNDSPIDRQSVALRLLRRSTVGAMGSYTSIEETREERIRRYAETDDLSYLVAGRLRERIADILRRENAADAITARHEQELERLQRLKDSMGLAPELLGALQGLLHRAARAFPNRYNTMEITQDQIDEIADALLTEQD